MKHWLILALCLIGTTAHAHPVPKQNHDRAIVVHITPEALIIDYRLELDRDGWTLFRDIAALADREAWAELATDANRYEVFSRVYAPRLAGLLTVKLDGRDLKLEQGPVPKPELTDSIRFPFVFRSSWRLEPVRRYQLTFYEGN